MASSDRITRQYAALRHATSVLAERGDYRGVTLTTGRLCALRAAREQWPQGHGFERFLPASWTR